MTRAQKILQTILRTFRMHTEAIIRILFGRRHSDTRANEAFHRFRLIHCEFNRTHVSVLRTRTQAFRANNGIRYGPCGGTVSNWTIYSFSNKLSSTAFPTGRICFIDENRFVSQRICFATHLFMMSQAVEVSCEKFDLRFLDIFSYDELWIRKIVWISRKGTQQLHRLVIFIMSIVFFKLIFAMIWNAEWMRNQTAVKN